MRYGLVLTLVVVFIMAFTVSAFAQYSINWSDSFDGGTVGAASAGTNGWLSVPTGGTITTSPKYSLAPTSDGISSQKGILQQGRSGITRNLKSLGYGDSYYTGVVRFWVYDPYPTTTAGALVTSQIDTRVGMYSNNSAVNMQSGSMSYCLAAGLTDTRGPYWTAYASSGFVVMNGTGAGTGLNIATGYTLTTANCAPAARKAGWNSIVIAFDGSSAATMHADYYINSDYENPQINARLDATTTAGRGLNLESMAGIYIGSAGTNPMGTWVDDVSFSGMGGPMDMQVTSITPNSGANTGSLNIIDLHGWRFETGATVSLYRSGQSYIPATNVNVVSQYKITCTFDLTGKAPGQWLVSVSNPSGGYCYECTPITFTIIDPSLPVINSVTVSPQMVAASDTVHVSVDATDNAEVMSVKANGTALTHSSGSSWSGNIVANSTLGLHTVTVVASDAANNVTTDTSQSYKTAQALGITNRDLVRDVTAGSTGQYLFTTWGRVIRLDANTFELEDGSTTLVRVTASGHGLATGDYAFARGIWSVTAIPPTLNSCSAWIEKVNL